LLHGSSAEHPAVQQQPPLQSQEQSFDDDATAVFTNEEQQQQQSSSSLLADDDKEAAATSEHGGEDGEVDMHSVKLGFLTPGGVAAAVYTMTSMSLGVGVFVLPGVLKNMGLITGLLALAVMALWGNWMQLILLRSASVYPSGAITSYEDLASNVLGSFGKAFLAFFTSVTMLLGNSAHMKFVVFLLHDLLEYVIVLFLLLHMALSLFLSLSLSHTHTHTHTPCLDIT
jgi:hypothetical protein